MKKVGFLRSGRDHPFYFVKNQSLINNIKFKTMKGSKQKKHAIKIESEVVLLSSCFNNADELFDS